MAIIKNKKVKQKVVVIGDQIFKIEPKVKMAKEAKGIVINQNNAKKIFGKAKRSLEKIGKNKKSGKKDIHKKSENNDDGIILKRTFELYKLWRVLPPIYKGYDRGRLEQLGFSDEMTLEMLAIKTQTAFAEKFDLSKDTLTIWNKKIDADGDADWKEWAKKLTPNIMGAFYRRLILKGGGQDVKAWHQLVEGFSEKSEVKVSGQISKILDDAEKDDQD